MFIRFILLVVSFCLISGAQANPMYLEAIEERPDEKRLAESRKTIHDYREIEIREDLDQQLPPFHRRS